MMWRVVETDNFCRDYPNESFVGPCFRSVHTAQTIANLINEDASGPTAERCWKVVESGYKLQPGFEP